MKIYLPDVARIFVFEIDECNWWADISKDEAFKNYSIEFDECVKYTDVKLADMNLMWKDFNCLHGDEETEYTFQFILDEMIKVKAHFPCLFATTDVCKDALIYYEN